MKFGDTTTLAVTAVDKKGRGCGTVNGKPACAHFTVPGEEVEATLIARRQGVLRFRVDRLVTPSPHRIEPRCRYAGRCGGCAWQQFDYDFQLGLKRDLINRSLEGGGIARRIDGVVPCPERFHYRNRMDYCVGPKGELGLKEPGRWNAYLDLEECHLLSPDAVTVMGRFRDFMREQKLEPWNATAQKGYVRYLVIREGKNTGKRMVTAVTAEGRLPGGDALVEALAPFATTIYHGVNPSVTDLSIASSLELLHGDELLEEEVAGARFLIHPNSFFQTNTIMAAKLVGMVGEFLADRRPAALLDLYCGVGFFGICLASSADRVIGVEIDPDAIAMARRNAELNGVNNASFEAAKAEQLIWERERPDTAIVDPPRAGLHPKVVGSLLANLPERIVYVSCNYESFVRDWQRLKEGYEISRMEAFDLFPHSPHVELVTLLEKRRS